MVNYTSCVSLFKQELFDTVNVEYPLNNNETAYYISEDVIAKNVFSYSFNVPFFKTKISKIPKLCLGLLQFITRSNAKNFTISCWSQLVIPTIKWNAKKDSCTIGIVCLDCTCVYKTSKEI